MNCDGSGVISMLIRLCYTETSLFQKLRSSGLNVQGDPVSWAKNELPVLFLILFLSNFLQDAEKSSDKNAKSGNPKFSQRIRLKASATS